MPIELIMVFVAVALISLVIVAVLYWRWRRQRYNYIGRQIVVGDVVRVVTDYDPSTSTVTTKESFGKSIDSSSEFHL